MRRFMRPAYKIAPDLTKNRIWNQGNYAVYKRNGLSINACYRFYAKVYRNVCRVYYRMMILK